MGVSGEAEVLAVSPCPPVEPGVGRVVTGTFRNERNHGLRALHVSVEGEVSCLRVTSGHPVWSVTRGAWIGAGELVPGEALAAWRGEPVAVLANLPEADTATWNLEVENEHVYRVGPAGILVHNTCPTPKELFEGGGGAKSVESLRTGGNNTSVNVKTKAEADALLKKSFPDYQKVRGVGPQDPGGLRKKRKMDRFKQGGAYHKDYHVDSKTMRIKGNSADNDHGTYPHINIKRKNGKKVLINVTGE
jgi:hypothetical protein